MDRRLHGLWGLQSDDERGESGRRRLQPRSPAPSRSPKREPERAKSNASSTAARPEPAPAPSPTAPRSKSSPPPTPARASPATLGNRLGSGLRHLALLLHDRSQQRPDGDLQPHRQTQVQADRLQAGKRLGHRHLDPLRDQLRHRRKLRSRIRRRHRSHPQPRRPPRDPNSRNGAAPARALGPAK